MEKRNQPESQCEKIERKKHGIPCAGEGCPMCKIFDDATKNLDKTIDTKMVKESLRVIIQNLNFPIKSNELDKCVLPDTARKVNEVNRHLSNHLKGELPDKEIRLVFGLDV